MKENIADCAIELLHRNGSSIIRLLQVVTAILYYVYCDIAANKIAKNSNTVIQYLFYKT